MKIRHQLFGAWVQRGRQFNKIRDQAIKLVKRKQERLEDSFNSSMSSESRFEHRDAKWLTKLN